MKCIESKLLKYDITLVHKITKQANYSENTLIKQTERTN